jgi:hypothetical protein
MKSVGDLGGSPVLRVPKQGHNYGVLILKHRQY